MNRIVLLSIVFLIGTSAAEAQIRKHARKRSTNSGSFFFYWGYNRAAYTPSTVRFIGSDYDFKLSEVKAHDRQPKFGANIYLNPAKMTTAQYNFRVGYYFKHKWAISVGVDHFNYVARQNSEAQLDGHFDSGADSQWEGNYNQEPVVLDPTHFRYEHAGGLNYLRIEVMRSIDLWEVGRKRQFAITANLGASVGPGLTTTNFYFGDTWSSRATALSGYGIGLNGSIRLEFFKHVFIQGEGGLAMMHLPGIRTNTTDRNQRAKQAFGLGTYNVSLGLIFYFKAKNACDSCPRW